MRSWRRVARASYTEAARDNTAITAAQIATTILAFISWPPRERRCCARVLLRARSSGAGGQPLEIQQLEVPSLQALDEFMTDGGRLSPPAARERVIAKTEIIEVQPVQPDPGR